MKQFPISLQDIPDAIIQQRKQTVIDIKIAEQAYKQYTKQYPSSAAGQSLEKIAQRGGFGIMEIINLLSGRINELENEYLKIMLNQYKK